MQFLKMEDRFLPCSHQVTAHIRRIEAVEKDLKALRDSSASKDDISRIRAEMKKLYDGLHVGEYEEYIMAIGYLTMTYTQNFWTCVHMSGEFVRAAFNHRNNHPNTCYH